MYGRAPPASVLGFLLVVVVCAGGSNADSSDNSKADVILVPAQLPTEEPAVLRTPVPLDWKASTAAPPPPCTGRSCNRRKDGPRSMKVLLIVSLPVAVGYSPPVRVEAAAPTACTGVTEFGAS
ncbi:hypothetical protein DIPPA_03872 [Diplonema papillatum]|nr:hypothetical protein DIPPA_03872 [Diplonema papillatum]